MVELIGTAFLTGLAVGIAIAAIVFIPVAYGCGLRDRREQSKRWPNLGTPTTPNPILPKGGSGTAPTLREYIDRQPRGFELWRNEMRD
jgi:hypothetical protein